MNRVAFPIKDGFEFVLLQDIIYLSADGNYSVAFIVNGQKKHVLRSIKHVESLLIKVGFARIHQEYLINMEHLIRYERLEGGSVLLSNGSKLPVARTRKKEFLKRVMGE